MSFETGTTAKEVINGLLKVQWQEYEYEDFLIVLKHRLRKYTGIEEVMFYSEEEVVEMLVEYNVVSLAN